MKIITRQNLVESWESKVVVSERGGHFFIRHKLWELPVIIPLCPGLIFLKKSLQIIITVLSLSYVFIGSKVVVPKGAAILFFMTL